MTAGFKVLFVFLFTTLCFAVSHASPNTMPCYEPFFSFAPSPGVIGTSCKATPIGDTKRALAYYEHYVFNFEKYLRSIDPTSYNRIYVDYILDLLEQVATDYYKERAALEKRTVTAAELQGWINAMLAVSYQESLMTHFQFDIRPDTLVDKMQVLVGDAKCAKAWEVKDGKYFCPEYEVNADGKKLYGSIGMFQIMLSVHSGSSKLGFFDIVHNVQYAMSFAYGTWSKIIKGTHKGLDACRDQIFANKKKNTGINYVNAARSMYSVYNGGPARVCRWTQDTIWKQNDNGYKYSIENKPWAKIASPAVAREKRKAKVTKPDGSIEMRYVFPFDLKCVRDGRDMCMKKSSIEFAADLMASDRGESNLPGVLYIHSDESTQEDRFCTWSNELTKYICVEDEKAAACLQQAQPEWRKEFEHNQFKANELSSEVLAQAERLEGDGDSLCPMLTEKVLPIGSEIWWPAAEGIRSWPESVASIQDVLYYPVQAKVLGFEVRPGRKEVWYHFEYYKNNIRQEGWGTF